MPINNLTIDTIADTPVTNPSTAVSVNPPPPWIVSGTVQYAGANTTQVAAMGYQIEDGPVNSFAPPDKSVNPSGYSFSLTNDDLPANGQYLLTVYAWDDDTTAAGSNTATAIIQCVNFPPILSLPKGCCT